jgi:hypothetical protein
VGLWRRVGVGAIVLASRLRVLMDSDTRPHAINLHRLETFALIFRHQIS